MGEKELYCLPHYKKKVRETGREREGKRIDFTSFLSCLHQRG